jgi:inner membrane protein
VDNLTHSLIGALIGQTGLKKLSGLGMPTLIIAANIPDVDAACFLWLEGTEHLGFRRGITHGPLAMLILPLLLTAAMVGFDAMQARRGTRPAARAPVRFGPLFLLALIGTLSHPAFDWLNNYGVRLLEPFSSRWFYGDSIFIIDVWMWAILIGGLVWSRRAEKHGANWERRGGITATIVGAYIVANVAASSIAEARTKEWLKTIYNVEPDLVVASPLPVAVWQREVFWRAGGSYRSRVINLADGLLPCIFHCVNIAAEPIGMDDPRIAAAARTDSQVRAFLFWSRMPFAERGADGSITLRDQRFTNPLTGDRFKVRIAPENGPAPSAEGAR